MPRQNILFSTLTCFVIGGGVLGMTIYPHMVATQTVVPPPVTEVVGVVAAESPTSTPVVTAVESFISAAAATTTNASTTVPVVVVPTTSTTTRVRPITPTSTVVTTGRIRVLVVAGHEPTTGGTEYLGLKERNLTLQLSQYLQRDLAANPKFDVIVARDSRGWNPVLSQYFLSDATATKNFYHTHQALMAAQVASGVITAVVGVPHNKAPEEAALHLYGISKWANEQAIDLIVHLHLNDHPRPDTSVPGKYTGFALYVPEHQYGNASASLAIARSVFPYLLQYVAVSTLPTESGGIVADQELIALGKYNTLQVPSLLIEYGYIYEPQFQTPVSAAATLQTLAHQTYLGIEHYFTNHSKH